MVAKVERKARLGSWGAWITLVPGLVALPSQAQTINAVANGQWDDALTWSNIAAPSANNHYEIGSGFVVNSPAATGGTVTQVFNGGSLTVANGGVLELLSNNLGPQAASIYNIENLTLSAGSRLALTAATGNIDRTLATPIRLAGTGTVTLSNNAGTSSFNNNLTLGPDATLSGTADFNLNFDVTGQSGINRKYLRVGSANNPYSGNWTVTSTNIAPGERQGSLYAGAPNALGTGHVTLVSSVLINELAGGINSINGVTVNDDSSVQLAGSWDNPNATLSLNAPTSSVVISNAGTRMSIGNLTGVQGSSISGNAAEQTLGLNTTSNSSYAGTISGTLAVEKTGAATLTLSGENTYTGPTIVWSGFLAVDGSIRSPNTLVQAAGTLTGSGLIAGDVLNRGTVWPGKAIVGDASFGSLTIAGNYAGTGGRLVLNSYLGGDGSPSTRLVIDGGRGTGSTIVVVNSAGGAGKLTIGDGILVISAVNGGATDARAFSLTGEVRGGAYDYRLYRGGLAGSNPDSWYLRNTFVVPPPPPILPPKPEIPGPVVPLDPPPEPLPPGTYPIIGPELATYGAVQPVARLMGFSMLGTMHERVGDSVQMEPAQDDTSQYPPVWGRILASSIKGHYRAFADPQSDGRLAGFQTGADLWRAASAPGHHDRAGIYVGYANANVDVNGLVTNVDATAFAQQRTGTVKLDAWSGGAYWTHFGPSDWYVDTVLQVTSYSGQAKTAFSKLSLPGTGVVASIEAGYPFALPQFGPGFALEPQVQGLWQLVSMRQRHDGEGEVDPGSTSGASGRIGIRGKWLVTTTDGQVWAPYVVANLWRDWGAHSTVVYSGAAEVPLHDEGSRMELGGGVTVKLKNDLSFYTSLGYHFSLSDSYRGRREALSGRIGLRKLW